MTTATSSLPPPQTPDQDEVERLIEQFDPESNFRRLVGVSAGIVGVLAVGLSGWHYYTAGFGLHNEIAHRAIHLAVVLGLCFLVFPRQKRLPGAWEWIVSAGLAALLAGKIGGYSGKTVGLVLSGGNVDPDLFTRVLRGEL